MKLKTKILILIAVSICFWSCEDKKSDPERGTIVSSSTIISYQASDIEAYLALSEMDIQLSDIHGVEAIKIVYETIDPHNNGTTASGAFFLPLETINPPLLSLQHGTETERDRVASVNPLNSVEGFLGLIMGAMGYCTAVPDYLGLGESDLLHPYLHAKSTATSVIDFLRAVRNYCDKNEIGLNDQLFLTGYSEGGYATLAVHREIEENYTDEFQLTAVAPMAGPYDLSGTVDSLFNSLEYTASIYPAFILTTYDNIYGWDRLDDFFQSTYAALLPDLFDGTSSYTQISLALPLYLSDLLKTDFVTAYINGNEPAIRAALEENTLLDWSPSVPLRFFHGNADEVVPYFNAITAVQNLSVSSSSTVELVTIEQGTHGTAGEDAILGMIEWFAQFQP